MFSGEQATTERVTDFKSSVQLRNL